MLVLLASLAPALAASALPVERVVSPGGIEAWLVEDHSNPLIAIAVGFRGGSALDPEGKAGLAEFVSGLLDEGAGELDSHAFQQRLADLAAELSFDASQDDFVASMRMLSANRDESLDLLRLALTAPRFDAEPLERVRRQFLALLARNADDADEIVGRVWQATAFPDHPYGRDSLGTPESIGAITAEDMHRFVDERFARDNIYVGVVGDITPEQLAGLLDGLFGALPAQSAPVTTPDVTPATAGQVIVVERDIPQSIVAFGHEGIMRHDPDFYAAYVVNHILGGGGFSSRLTEEVREKRGLAYSIGTYLATYDHAALVGGSVGTQNARVAETIALVRQEWQRMREEGPTAQELADAKTYLTGSYPLRFTSSTATARTLVAVQIEGFGPEYFAERNGYIEAVTLEDARRVAKRLLQPENLTVVVVGKPEGVEPTVPAAPDTAAAPAAGADGLGDSAPPPVETEIEQR